MLVNVLAWVGYDISVMAYTSLIGRVILIISIISEMLRIDYVKNKKEI